ncbi:MAG: PAS domain-containing protein [Gemmatimonadota bacterium]
MRADLLIRLLNASSNIACLETDANGDLTYVNPAFAAHVGRDTAELQGQPVFEVLAAADATLVRGWLSDSVPADPVELNFTSPEGSPFTLRCVVERSAEHMRIVGEPNSVGDRAAAAEIMRVNNEFATMVRELARRERELERTRGELETALTELQTSYWHLQKIQEVLPVCMECGRVKTGDAGWEPVLEYLKANRIFMSHGYCPACTDEVMARYGLDDEASQ